MKILFRIELFKEKKKTKKKQKKMDRCVIYSKQTKRKIHEKKTVEKYHI